MSTSLYSSTRPSVGKSMVIGPKRPRPTLPRTSLFPELRLLIFEPAVAGGEARPLSSIPRAVPKDARRSQSGIRRLSQTEAAPKSTGQAA